VAARVPDEGPAAEAEVLWMGPDPVQGPAAAVNVRIAVRLLSINREFPVIRKDALIADSPW